MNSIQEKKNLFYLCILAVVDPLRARYLIAHKLASGGFGDVYAGVRKKDGMRVALKVIPKNRMREINTVRKRKNKIFKKN
jgi:serine/threonine protein kinase